MFLTTLLAWDDGDHLPVVAWLDRASIGVTATLGLLSERTVGGDRHFPNLFISYY
jgi:hypothetical protein